MKRLVLPPSERGFTLIEVLVAILLVAIGIFGFAKMQALALSSTQVSSARSIVSMQASSLAAAMQGNRTYWASGVAPASFSTAQSTVTDATGVLSATVGSCEAAAKPATPACTSAQLAARDVQQWASNLANLLPTSSSTVSCSTSTSVPVSCVLTISWKERYVASTRATASDSAATGGSRSFTLYIEP
ncbi:type IV pilus modification protein PilV [Variovorax boronicumulans]|uniref:type IV pilus modification protein PilV n=1 Tax=Variovorax boronicumulans TaxID=436515 RepID=UPI001C57CF44